MIRRSIVLAIAAVALAAAGEAYAQSSSPANPGGQALGEGFFAGGAGGVGSGAVGSPINTNTSAANLFGPGGLWADAKPVTSTNAGNGVQLVDSPAATNGSVNGSAGVGAATQAPRVNLGGMGPGHFLVR